MGTVDHVDLYRVKSDQDLESSGFWDLFDHAGTDWSSTRVARKRLPRVLVAQILE